MKPRKHRRLMLTGHRVRVLRETKGHAVPDRALKRSLYLRRFFGPSEGNPSHYQWRPKGKHPEQKPKDKK